MATKTLVFLALLALSSAQQDDIVSDAGQNLATFGDAVGDLVEGGGQQAQMVMNQPMRYMGGASNWFKTFNLHLKKNMAPTYIAKAMTMRSVEDMNEHCKSTCMEAFVSAACVCCSDL